MLVDRFSFLCSFPSFCGAAAGGSGDFARPTPYCDDSRPNAAEKSLGGDDGFLSGVDEDALDVVVTETREGETRLDPDDELLDIVGVCRVGDVCSRVCGSALMAAGRVGSNMRSCPFARAVFMRSGLCAHKDQHQVHSLREQTFVSAVTRTNALRPRPRPAEPGHRHAMHRRVRG